MLKRVSSAAQRTKAVLSEEKNRAIVQAARDVFLRDGFSGASMDGIARVAGVSVKTVYSHFVNKDQLFREVMLGTCSDNVFSDESPSAEKLSKQFAWFSQATRKGMALAGETYLQHLLSGEQLALYRVVTRDAGRFPEIGEQYRRYIARGRTAIVVAYFRNIAQQHPVRRRDAVQDAEIYEGLLRAGIFEAALLGLVKITDAEICRCAASAAATMWKLFKADP